MKQPRPVLVLTWLQKANNYELPYQARKKALHALLMHFDSLEDAQAYANGEHQHKKPVSWLLKKLA